MAKADKNLVKAKKQLFRALRREVRSEAVLRAMERVPRERFVPPEARHMAYENIPLGIGSDQTISQPYIVAIMSEALELRGDEKVLEVGTGSGYQAGVLSNLLPRGHLYTVERIPELARKAQATLSDLGHRNVTVELAGEVLGSPRHAPFDAIIVTAAAPRLPQELTDQLAVGGRLVIPVGSREEQELIQVRRTEEGLSVRWLGPCRFVPLIGRAAFPSP